MRPPSRFSHPFRPFAVPLVLGAVLLFGLAPAASAVVETPIPVHCLAQSQLIATGVTDRPADDYLIPTPDHRFLHSGTNLQGQPTYEKFAAGLFWFPPAPAELSSFQSAVVVTNPNPGVATFATVEFFDQVGTLVGSTSFALAPEASRVVTAQSLLSGPSATPGLGSARVT